MSDGSGTSVPLPQAPQDLRVDYRKGEWMGIAMQWRDAQRRLTLQLAPGSRMLPPAKRQIQLCIAGSSDTRSAVFAGQALTIDL